MSVSEPPAQNEYRQKPVMSVTSYDKSSAGMIAAVLTLLGITALLVAVYFTNYRPPKIDAVPIELVEMPGGYEDGSPDETPNLESPEEEVPDPAIAETTDEAQVQEMLETIVELSDSATQQVEMVIQSESSTNSGQTGSATGTGGRPLGMGGGGKGGFPAEQRWFIKFDDDTLDVYARQLDHFGIELAAFYQSEAKLVYISDLARPKPTVREVKTGGDDRLFMTWRGGTRRQADESLFKKAGYDATGIPIMHMYPKETEQLLAQVEVDYRNRRPTEIRRTYFSVRKDGAGFKFVVTSQSYLR